MKKIVDTLNLIRLINKPENLNFLILYIFDILYLRKTTNELLIPS